VPRQADGVGSKWSFTALRKHYAATGVDSTQVFASIHDVIIKACIAVEPHIVNNMNRGTRHKAACFEIYGFDILLDSGLRPWLLEVNVCPSLSSSSPLDKRIKTTLMCDIFTLIGVVPFDRKQTSKDLDSAKQKRLFTGGPKSGRPQYRGLQALTAARDLNEYPMTEEDWKVLLETDEEESRRGHFQRIFPLRDNAQYYEHFFEAPRYNNLLVWKWLHSSESLLKRQFRREVCSDPV